MEQIIFTNTALLLIVIALLFLIRKNTLLNLILLTLSIPLETYINFKIGFTLKPVQIFAVSTFFSMVSNNERPWGSFKEHIPYLFILVAQILSLINAPEELIFKGYQGSIRMILNFFLLYFIAHTISYAIKNVAILKKVILSLIIGGMLSVSIELARAALTFRQSKHLFSMIGEGYLLRLSPFDLSPNQYAAYLLIVMVFLTVAVFQKTVIQSRFFQNIHPVLFGVIFYGFVLTFSRGPWLGYAVALIMIFCFFKDKLKKSLIRYLCYTTISIALLLTVYPRDLHPFIERSSVLTIYNSITYKITSDKKKIFPAKNTKSASVKKTDISVAERVSWYKNSAHTFSLHPIIGNGWASNLIPHNILIQILSESGIIGFSAFILFAFFVSRRSYKAIRMSRGDLKALAVGIWASLCGTFIFLMTDIGLYQTQTWFIIGLALSMARIEEINGKPL